MKTASDIDDVVVTEATAKATICGGNIIQHKKQSKLRQSSMINGEISDLCLHCFFQHDYHSPLLMLHAATKVSCLFTIKDCVLIKRAVRKTTILCLIKHAL